MLLGIAAALNDRHDRVGLWFPDGHADHYNGCTFATGKPPTPSRRSSPGTNPPSSSTWPTRRSYLPPDLFHIDATAIVAFGAAAVAEQAHRRLAGRGHPVWAHVDLDALDEQALPAVNFPLPRGLDWPDLAALLIPLLASPDVAGLSVNDYNADLDPYGRSALAILKSLAAVAPARGDAPSTDA